MEWTECIFYVPAEQLDAAAAIATMVAPLGIYIEDYSNLEQEIQAIAHTNLVDEALLAKNRAQGILHIYYSPLEPLTETLAFLQERFNAQGIPYTLAQEQVEEASYADNWKRYFKPTPIGQKLLILPSWEAEVNPEGRAILQIDPGAAFGTGTHATTRLCLEALEEAVTPGMSVLDIGCGSGILAIAALLLGAGKAHAIDIDALAVKTAAENGVINGFAPPALTVIQGDLTAQITGQYMCIVSNIVADVIIQLSREVSRFLEPGGVWLASGIIEDRLPEVRAALAENGWHIAAQTQQEGWICLQLTRNID